MGWEGPLLQTVQSKVIEGLTFGHVDLSLSTPTKFKIFSPSAEQLVG